MDKFFIILKKMVVGMVFVVFGTTMVYVPQHFGQFETVPKAHAGPDLVFDPIGWIQTAATAIASTAMSIFDSTLNLKEFTLDGIAWAIAKQVVSNMVSSLVDWINSGFQGSPAFVQDLGGFLLQAADEAFATFIKDGSFICSPFRLDVQIAVAVKYDQSRRNDPPTCTISGIFNNFEAFIDGEFSEGGWNDWFKVTSRPNVYTEYGSILSAEATARARVINAKGEELNILDFGNGFLSGKLCETAEGTDGTVEECFITKPGRVIADSLNKALGAGQDALVTADEISEIIAALLGQLANAAITGTAGLLGLSGGTGYTYRGYSRGSFAEELRSGANTTTGGVNTATSTVTGGIDPGDITFAADYIIDSLSQQQASLTRIEAYRSELQDFANNPLNSEEDRYAANLFLNEANTFIENITNGIAEIRPIVDEYIALEREYTNATVERRIEIRGLQSEVVQRFNAVGVTNPRTLESMFSRWDNLLAQNVDPTDTNNNGIPDNEECIATPFSPCVLIQ